MSNQCGLSEKENSIVYKSEKWKIIRHESLINEVWFTLHKRKKFLKIEWWSGIIKFGTHEELMKHINKKR